MSFGQSPRPAISFLWTLISMVSAWPVLAFCVGDAAWNGINLAVGLCLFLSVGGFLGLLAGFCAAVSSRGLYAWITCISALAVACLSIFLGCEFIFGRDPAVPFNRPVYFGAFHAPIIVLYGVAFVCCSVEAVLFYLKTQPFERVSGR
jgi:hypothetical protein